MYLEMIIFNVKHSTGYTNTQNKRHVYATSGVLMSVHESPSKRRDIVYANGEAIAEIDQDGNVYELHNDHLGTPRYVTSRTTGKIVGEQAFGPYGEEMAGTYNGQALPTGYKPVTGYTGHLNEDLSGLIYMKGRYYSPLWHRFINSDQGVDPRSINQYAYVGGSPFMAKDPMGMAATMYCTTYHYSTGDTVFGYNPETGFMEATVVVKDNSYKVCYILDWDDWRGGWPGDYGEVGSESGGGGIGPRASKDGQAREVTKRDCDLIREVLAKEKKSGTRIAAHYGLNNGFAADPYTNNTANNYGNMIPTKYGPIDLDWFATLSGWGLPKMPSNYINITSRLGLYAAAKIFWGTINTIMPSTREGSYRFEIPYSDPGERIAASAYATGATFADLFDQAWLDKYCGGK
jgi:RHS repeat-associated protein